MGRLRPGHRVRTAGAQLAKLYTPEQLQGRQVLAVVNFPPKQIVKFLSEVLVLGVLDEKNEVVLIQPERRVPNGSRLL